MILRQLFDTQSSTYTYVLADEATRQAIIIDPVFEQVRKELALIEELNLQLVASLETHVHADHITGAWLLKDKLGSKIALSSNAGAQGADIYLKHGDRVMFGKRYVEARATPGHTSGCMTYVADDQSVAFTGDALLIRGCGRTDFQQGSAATLFHSVHEQVFTLPDNCLIYPGHDYNGSMASSVGEEKKHNPRLGLSISEADFSGYMENLGLPHPKLMDIAVPANVKCGKPDEPPVQGADWGPVHTTFAGVPEIAPQWVEDNLKQIFVLDVREPSEFNDVLGHVPGAQLIPLGHLGAHLKDFSKDKPIAVICRSGARSARATLMLRQNGFDQVANVSGGMLRWRSEHLTTE
jgi:glyoxylase-like metal-dependent hydrolase (beta-lactamase superfamily II)/rhodanese-related sulfurtransferase